MTTGDVCVGGVCAGATSDQPFVVHEWGTFTSVKASDGHTLGGVHHIDEALPAWVHRRATNEPWGYDVEGIPEEPLQQLETPVLYFHSGPPRAVRVDISFPQGVVGEWYPSATSFTPAIGALTALGAGAMRWDLVLAPGLPTASFPPVSPDEIWAPSRQVSSAPVRAATDEREQFVFYRGLGKFDPPVKISAPSDQTLHLENLGSEGVPAAFVLVVKGAMGAFSPVGPLPAGATMDTAIPATAMSSAEMIAAARSGLRLALEATGLYPDEAIAMVDTWTRSWFHAEGIRVLYIAPRAWTDGWLPTTITPAPSSLVRTLVGRVDMLTPGDEAGLVKLVKASGPSCALDVTSLGRFAEARLFRAVELTADKTVLACAQALRTAAHTTNNYP